jgi:hypothetical protein
LGTPVDALERRAFATAKRRSLPACTCGSTVAMPKVIET